MYKEAYKFSYSQFQCKELSEFSSRYDVESRFTQVYSANSNGLAECHIDLAKKQLKITVVDCPHEWHRHLPAITKLINTTPKNYNPNKAAPRDMVFKFQERIPFLKIQREFRSDEIDHDLDLETVVALKNYKTGYFEGTYVVAKILGNHRYRLLGQTLSHRRYYLRPYYNSATLKILKGQDLQEQLDSMAFHSLNFPQEKDHET